MKTARGISGRPVLGMLASAGFMIPMGAVAQFDMFELGEAVERDEVAWERLTEAGHEVQAGVGYISTDSFMFGRFDGLTDEGLFLDLHVDLHARPSYDAEEMNYWRLRGRNLGLDSRSLRLDHGRQGLYSTFFEFRQMPHYQWRDVHIRHSGAGTRELTSDTPRDFDIEQERQSFALGGAYLMPESRWRISSDVTRETRDGTRLRGFETRFGAGAGSVAPELVDYHTDRYNLSVNYMGQRFQGGVGYHLSRFAQDKGSTMFVDGETFGLEPENTFHRLSFTGGYTVAEGTRISGDLHLGRMLQDDRFPASGTSVTRDGVAVTNLDGEIATTALNLRGAHRLSDRARLRAAFRYDDRDNTTGVYEVAGRETMPLSYTRTHYSVDGDYRLASRTRLSAGVERDERDRDFGDRRKTNETTVHTQLNTTLAPGLSGGVRLAYSEQDGTTYDETRRNPVPEGLRNYDIADRDRYQVGLFATYTPSALPDVSFSGRAQYTDDDYTRSDYGRTAADWFSAHGEVTWVPVERLSLYAFGGWDRRQIDLAGETWTADQDVVIATGGFGAQWAYRPDRLDLGFEFVQVSSRGRMDFDNGTPANHPALESNFIELSLHGELYNKERDMSIRARYAYQRFTEQDWALGENVVTANPVKRDYNAQLFLVSGVFRF
jgi:MtrB/PioB family decaheme-associated outer membrane protein